MDQVKIGKFIAECRKKQNLTQLQLADQLGITDRAVSKWENGKAMPDSSIMLELCDVLQITVNDLLNGEVISAESYKLKIEDQLLELFHQKEISDKRLRKLAVWFAVMTTVLYFLCTALLILSDLSLGWYWVAFFASTLIAYICMGLSLKLQQYAGYYRCLNCGHTYTPTMWSFWNALPGRHERIIVRCPACKKCRSHEWVSRKEK